MKLKPRIFRARRPGAPEVISFERRGNALSIGRPFLPSVAAWAEAHRSRFKAGTVYNVVVEHDAGCRYPAGAPCSCVMGPEIKVDGIDPRDN
jgi:hypothetical protein